MENVKEQLVQATDNFLATIAQLTQQYAAQTFQGAFAQLGGSGQGELPDRSSSRVGKSNGHAAAAPSSDSNSRAPKRGPDELEQLSKRFVQYVSSHPGLRIEQINKELGTTTAELALPIRKLIAAKTLTVKGQKRSTSYFIKGGAAPVASAEETEGSDASPKARKKRSSGGKRARSSGKAKAKSKA